jgi:hypothetical protein
METVNINQRTIRVIPDMLSTQPGCVFVPIHSNTIHSKDPARLADRASFAGSKMVSNEG